MTLLDQEIASNSTLPVEKSAPTESNSEPVSDAVLKIVGSDLPEAKESAEGSVHF